jgi:hypothetical protein
MDNGLRAELERVFDTVSVDASGDGEIYRAAYWEDDQELELEVDCERRTANVVLRRDGTTEQFCVSPLDRVTARTAHRPYRLDLDKPYGGRLTIWFKPLCYSISGSL